MSEIIRHRAERIGLWAGTLAATEIGLGSILHGLHLPLAGTLMSLNQAVFLTRATYYERENPRAKSIPIEVSSITAILKSFSPIGKKLTPMLAISAQGALFSLGLYMFGLNLLGIMLGSVLLASWGIIQPLAIAGLMFWSLSSNDQQKIIMSWERLVSELPILGSVNLMTAVTIFLGLKCLLVMTLSATAWTAKPSKVEAFYTRFINKLTSTAAKKTIIPQLEESQPSKSSAISLTKANPLTQALRDLRNPVVLISLAFLTVLFAFVNSDLVGSVWVGLRALATAYITYVTLRLLPWDHLLAGRSASKISLREALNQLKKLHVDTTYSNNLAADRATEKTQQA